MTDTTRKFNTAAILLFLVIFLSVFSGTSQAAHPDGDVQKALEIQDGIRETVARVTPTFVSVGGGSGVIIDEDGYFLTNYHVASQIFRQTDTTTVLLTSGKSYTARKISYDPYGDTALCKIEPPEGSNEKFPYAKMGDSDNLEQGQVVIAVGNPFSLSLGDAQPTVTVGFASAGNRYITTRGDQGPAYTDAIMIDASINPGNSGGPLFDINGNLLGINGLMFSRFGHRSNTGVGYAVSINQIKRFLPLLRKQTFAYHGTINGLTLESFPPDCKGAIIKTVEPGTLAEKTGFKTGDVVIEVNGNATKTNACFAREIHTWPEDTMFKVRIKRGKKEEMLSFKSERIPVPWANPDKALLGVVFDQAFPGPGAKIDEVVEDYGAEKAGLKAGDIILKIDGASVPDIPATRQLLRRKNVGDKVELTIKRGSETLEVAVEMMKAEQPE